MIHAAIKEVATVQSILNKYHTQSSNPHVEHVLQQLKNCRTAQLGYHLYKCSNSDCMKFKYQYHSCRNRHCPACGSMQKEQWLMSGEMNYCPSATTTWYSLYHTNSIA